MDEDRIKRVVERQRQTYQQMAESQATVALGEAVQALYGRQLLPPDARAALLAQLLEPVQDLAPGHLRRLQAEAAARLLGWTP